MPMNFGATQLYTRRTSMQHGTTKRCNNRAPLGTRLYNSAKRTAQKHFLCTMVGPDSSYSLLEIQICSKVLREERMEPPIHTEYFRSGAATTLIFTVEGAKAVSSLAIRSPIPANIVVPPDSTIL